MIIVSDTSAITSLFQIGKIGILDSLFQSIVIPKAVEQELLREHQPLPAFLQVVSPKSDQLASELEQELDDGEADAIAIMLDGQGDIPLIDERRGRRAAQARGIKLIGLIGVLVQAKHAGLIESIQAVVDELEQTAGFRISKSLRQRILELEDTNAPE